MVDDVLLDETNDVDCDEMDHVKDVEGGRIVSYKLPFDEKDNTQIKEISKNAFHESFLLLKRDFNVITHYHMKRLDKLKRKSKENKSDAPSCSSPRPAGSTQPMPSKSDEDMYDEAFFKELDDIMKKFCEMKNKTVDEYPKFDLLSQSPKVEEQNEVEVEGYEEHNEAEDVVVQNASEEKFAEEDDGRYTMEQSMEQTVHYKVEKFDKGVNVCGIDPMSCLAHDDMSISNDALFKSKFMSRNGRYLKGFSTLQKHIVDYCLHHDKAMMTEGNVFMHDFNHHKFIMSYNSINTLDSSLYIDFSIIDGWALILNKSVKYHSSKSSTKIQKFYFNTQHSLSLSNVVDVKKFADVRENEYKVRSTWHYCLKQMCQLNDIPTIEFFFVPICHKEHFTAVVINLVERKIQFLDNQKDNYRESSIYWKLVHLVKEQFSLFLRDMEHPRCMEVDSYPIEVVPFKWQKNDRNIDCGVFLLNHMENFVGSLYDYSDLLSATARRKLRAMYCSRIILSDLNDCREHVLSRIHEPTPCHHDFFAFLNY